MLTLGIEHLTFLIVGIIIGYFLTIQKAEKKCANNDMATITLIHEVRNQLTGIRWIFNLLAENAPKDGTADEAGILIKEGDKKISSALDIINDTFKIVKLGNPAVFKPEANNLIEVTKICIDDYKIPTKERNIKVKFTADESLSNVVFDKAQMLQALRNIIGNAIKYSNTDGTVEIELKRNDNFVEIAVKDDGIGIPSNDQPMLFTKFFRAKNAENLSGSGLGLYIAKDIIARHNGRIEVQSSEGKGSKFTIIFPAKNS